MRRLSISRNSYCSSGRFMFGGDALVDVGLFYYPAMGKAEGLQAVLLGRDRKALAGLLLRRDADVKDGVGGFCSRGDHPAVLIEYRKTEVSGVQLRCVRKGLSLFYNKVTRLDFSQNIVFR